MNPLTFGAGDRSRGTRRFVRSAQLVDWHGDTHVVDEPHEPQGLSQTFNRSGPVAHRDRRARAARKTASTAATNGSHAALADGIMDVRGGHSGLKAVHDDVTTPGNVLPRSARVRALTATMTIEVAARSVSSFTLRAALTMLVA